MPRNKNREPALPRGYRRPSGRLRSGRGYNDNTSPVRESENYDGSGSVDPPGIGSNTLSVFRSNNISRFFDQDDLSTAIRSVDRIPTNKKNVKETKSASSIDRNNSITFTLPSNTKLSANDSYKDGEANINYGSRQSSSKSTKRMTARVQVGNGLYESRPFRYSTNGQNQSDNDSYDAQESESGNESDYSPYVDEFGDVQNLPRNIVCGELDNGQLYVLNRVKKNEKDLFNIKTSVDEIKHLLKQLSPGVNGNDNKNRGIQNTNGVQTDALSIAGFNQTVTSAIDTPIKNFNYEGRDMITSPSMFKVGSTVFWKYANDMMKDVKIIESIPPTSNRKLPIYQVEFGHGENEVVCHDQLYIPTDSTPRIHPNGIINATAEVLPASAQLHMSVMETKNPRLVKLFDAMNDEKFKLETFRSSINDMALVDDKLATLKQAHSTIVMAALAASKGSLRMPSLEELSPTISIQDIMTPPADYPLRPRAMAFLSNLANCVLFVLHKPEFAKEAPIAKRHINAVKHTKNGLEARYYLLTKRFAYLGALDFDAYDLIKSLSVQDGVQLSDFLSDVQEVQTQLQLSCADVSPNALLKQLYNELFKTNMSPLIMQQRHNFNNFCSKNPKGKAFTEDSVDSIVTYLLEGQSDAVVRLNTSPSGPDSESRLNVPSSYRNAVSKHRYTSNFSKPTYAVMNSPKEIEGDKLDDASVEDFTEEDRAKIDEIIKPTYAMLQKTGDESANEAIYKDLFFSALKHMKQGRKIQCEACLGYHDVDGCWARGPEFQDEALRKRVNQVNARLGTKPKNPPQPKTPPAATFSSPLQQKSMTTKAVQFENIKYNSMSTPHDVEQALDDISTELERAVESGTMTTDPKMAVISVTSETNKNSEVASETNKNSNAESLADVMQVADYYVYNEQVNC